MYRWAPDKWTRVRTEPAPSELLKATGMLPRHKKNRSATHVGKPAGLFRQGDIFVFADVGYCCGSGQNGGVFGHGRAHPGDVVVPSLIQCKDQAKCGFAIGEARVGQIQARAAVDCVKRPQNCAFGAIHWSDRERVFQ
jgi:hypothetical protein